MVEKHSGRYPWKLSWIEKMKYWFRLFLTMKVFRLKFSVIVAKTTENSRLLDLDVQECHLYDFEDAICWEIVDTEIVTNSNKKINTLTFHYYGSVWAYLKMKRRLGRDHICVFRSWSGYRCWIKGDDDPKGE